MVPTLQCGLLRSNFSFAILCSVLCSAFLCGAGALARVFCRPYGTLIVSSPTRGSRPGLKYSAPSGLVRGLAGKCALYPNIYPKNLLASLRPADDFIRNRTRRFFVAREVH